MKTADPVTDQHGWISTDHRLPVNMEMVLIWNEHQKAVQFAEFKMYSSTRYEFVQGADAVSIHAVTHWQAEPQPPDEKVWATIRRGNTL